MKILDRSRPFGVICGAMPNGARYEQDGLLFDAHEQLIPGQVEQVITESKPLGEDFRKITELTEIEPMPVTGAIPVVVDFTEKAMAMAEEGATKKDIIKATGLHHKTVEKIIRDAQNTTDDAVE